MGRVTCVALAILLTAAGLIASPPPPAAAAGVPEQEPNGGYDNATWLALGDTCAGRVGFTPDDASDYFRFNVSKQQQFTINVFVTATAGSCGLTIFRPSRTIFTYAMVPNAPFPWSQQRNVGEENGTWYLCVRGVNTTYSVSSSGSSVGPDQPPAVAIASPANGSEVATTTVAVSGTASDDHLVSRVLVYPEGAMPPVWTLAAGTTSWTATVSISGYVAQDHSVRIVARAEDSAGNFSTAVVTLTFTGDVPPPTPPRVDIISPEEGAAVWGLELVVRGLVTGSRPVTKVEVSPDGAAWAAVTVLPGVDLRYSWNTTLDLAPGAHAIRVRATDALATGEATVNVTVLDPSTDRTPPTIAITSPAAYAVLPFLTFNVNGTAADDSRVVSVWVWVPTYPMARKLATTTDGWANWTVQLALTRGSYTVHAQAEDLNGNVANVSRYVNVAPPDDVPPRVSIHSPVSGDHLGTYQLVRIEGNASDDVGIDRILIDVDQLSGVEVPVPPGTTSYNWTAFVNLTYYGMSIITVSVSDKAGNAASDDIVVYRDNPHRSPGAGAPLASLALLAAVAVATLGRRGARR